MKIAFTWNELPAYGARLLRSGIQELNEPVEIVATKPIVPIKGMDEILGQKIHWIEKKSIISWEQLGIPIPDLFFQAGWYIDSFISLGNEVKQNGGKVILLSDNCWKNSWRQWGGALIYRLKYRRYFDAVWVPGASGAFLMKFLGVDPKRIYQGLYGSDPNSFTMGAPLSQRKKQFIYVGKLVPEKGIAHLLGAFSTFYKQFPDWQLIIYGDGPLRILVENKPGVTSFAFAQPPQVASAMRESRFLVLPTLTDHWPLVVNEACLSGCGVIVSNVVGNIKEFVGNENGIVYPLKSERKLIKAFIKIARLNDDQKLDRISAESRSLGVKYTPQTWAEVFKRILAES